MSNEDSSSRKLIKWGSSRTLIISLPRKWVKKNNLKPEQEIKAIENPDGSLSLFPHDINEKSEIVSIIEIKDVLDLETIWLKINTLYLDGCDVIKLTTKSEFSHQLRNHIEQVIAPLLGLEILGTSQKEIMIKDVMAIGSSNIMSLIRMIGDQAIELAEMFYRGYESPSEREFLDPQIIRKSIQKYYYRITRELRKSVLQPIILSRMGINVQDVLDISFFITNVNDISENLVVIINSIKPLKSSFLENYIEKDYLRKTIKVLKNSIDSFLFRNSSLAIDQIKIIDDMKKQNFKIERNLNAKNDEFLPIPLLIELNTKILDQTRIICFSALRRAI